MEGATDPLWEKYSHILGCRHVNGEIGSELSFLPPTDLFLRKIHWNSVSFAKGHYSLNKVYLKKLL